MKEVILEQEVEKEFHKHPGDLFNPVSRTLTKYSYGMCKETSSKLETLMNKPWEMFEQAKGQKGERHDVTQCVSN